MNTPERTNRELLAAFVRELDERGRTREHVTQMRRFLERFLPLERRPADFLRQELVERINGSFKAGTRSRQYVHEAFAAFFRWASNNGELPAGNPMQGVPAPSYVPDRVRRALFPEELRRLVAAVPLYRGVCYQVIATTGLRPKELRRLDRADLDLDNAIVTVHPRRAKAQPKPTSIPLTAETVEVIRRYLAEDGERFAGRVIPRTPRAEQFYLDLERAGIPRKTAEGELDVYALRVAYVTNLFRGGASLALAQKLARHSSPHLTSGVYSRFLLEEERQAVERAAGAAPVARKKKTPRRRGRKAG